MDNQYASLVEPVAQPPYATLRETDQQSFPVQGQVADLRSQRYHLAMGENSPGLDTINNAIITGQDGDLRRTAAEALTAQQQQRRLTELTQLAQRGTTPSQALSAVQGVQSPIVVNPSTVMERGFADRTMEMLVNNDNSRRSDSVVSQAMAENPQEARQAMIGTQAIVARQQLLRHNLENMEAQVSQSGWGEYLLNLGQTMVPGLSSYRMSPDLAVGHLILPGTTLQQERAKFWGFDDINEAEAWLKKRTQEIARSNPIDAVQFARSMVSLGTEESRAYNIFGAADTQAVGGVAAAVGKAGLTMAGFKALLRNGAAAVEDGTVRLDRIAEASGDIPTAARLRTAKEVIHARDETGQAANILDNVPTLNNPSSLVGPGETNLAREATQRNVGELKSSANRLMTAINQGERAQRIPQEVLQPLINHAEEMARLHYPSINDGILDVRLRTDFDTNTRHAEIILGKKDGTLFRNEEQLMQYARNEYGIDDHLAFKTSKVDTTDTRTTPSLAQAVADTEVTRAKSTSTPLNNIVSAQRQGNNWYIRILQPLDETHQDYARALQITTKNENPVNVGNWWLGGLARSAEDQLSYFQRSNRHMALHVPQEVQRVMVEQAQRIGTLSKDSRNALRKVLDANKDYVDYSMPPELQRGRAYRNQSQLEKAWWDANGKMPTEKESLAYFTYHQVMDTDWVIRNFGVYRDLVRQGAKEYTIPIPRAGQDALPVNIHGRLEKDLPTSKSDYGILLVQKDGTTKQYWRNDLDPKTRDYLKNLIQSEGHQVIQVANPADRPLANATGIKSTINYVITHEHTSRPLPVSLIDYAPGVHVMYPQQHFVKQPVIEIGEGGRWIHYGDKTIFAVDTEREATRLSKAMTTLQNMFRNKASEGELNTFISRNLPEDIAYWRSQFTAGENGKEAYLSMNHPIGNTFSGKGYFDTRPEYKKNFPGLREERKSEFNMYRSIDMDFLANRDGPLLTSVNRGSYEQPLYKLEQARTLDPFAAINRTLGNSIRNLYLNDYKIGAIEQWTQQYAHLLRGDPTEHLKNPFQAFYDGRFNQNITNRAQLASAQNTKDRIIQFLGTKTELGRDLNLVQQKLMNWIEKGEQTTVAGQRLLPQGATQWYNDHELALLKNPIAAVRSMMFDFRFGFFNPAQLMVQSQGFVHVTALAGPEVGGKAFAAYSLQRMLLKMSDDPKNLEYIANMAAKLGLNKEHFIEAYTTMKNQGVAIIGKEHALRDGAWDPQLFNGRFGNFLESGRGFFKEGEKLTRMTAWNAAHLEWRKANPTKTLDAYGLGEIHTRADDLWGNMTKASNSALQEGVYAIPTQFFTFSHRLLEQAWGGRIPWQQKVQAFLTHSAMYGAPVALGIGIPWPMYESIRQTAMENGLPIHNGYFEAATSGALGYLLHLATGSEYNIEQRYGPGFPDTLKKLVKGETSAIELAGGALGSFTMSMAKASYPFAASMVQGMNGEQSAFPLTQDDILGVLREISSVNNAWNMTYALNTGKYISRNGTLIQGVNDPLRTQDAIAMIFSLTRRDISDTRLQMGSMKEQAAAQRNAQALGEREYRRGLQYLGDGDARSADVYFTRAKVYWTAIGDLRDEQINQSIQRVHTEAGALVDRAREQFTQRGNKSQLPSRLQRLLDGR